MKNIAMIALAAALLCAPCLADESADEREKRRVLAAVAYLSSAVPEARRQAEIIIADSAEKYFDDLRQTLGGTPPAGRVALLRILMRAEHDGRASLGVGILCDPDSRREERAAAREGLRGLAPTVLLAEIETRLRAESDEFTRFQLCVLLGAAPQARAQSLAEAFMQDSRVGSLWAFAAEDASLRSILDSPLSQAGWARYQQRRPEAPRMTLREFQTLLDDLALPAAPDRARAKARLIDVIGGNDRLLLALSRSSYPERAMFALSRLRLRPPRQLAAETRLVIIDLLATARRTVALMALEVAAAGNPPAEAELNALRPFAGGDAMARLENIVARVMHLGDLGEIRRRHDLLEARLRPLLAAGLALNPEIRQLREEYAVVREDLDALQKEWVRAWREEFGLATSRER